MNGCHISDVLCQKSPSSRTNVFTRKITFMDYTSEIWKNMTLLASRTM